MEDLVIDLVMLVVSAVSLGLKDGILNVTTNSRIIIKNLNKGLGANLEWGGFQNGGLQCVTNP